MGDSFTAANTQLTASSVFFVAPKHPADDGRQRPCRLLRRQYQHLSAVLDQPELQRHRLQCPDLQVWGTLFDGSGGNGGSIYLRAVQLGLHNLNPTDSDPSGQYAVNSELIGFVMTVDVGNLFGSAAGSPPDCTTGTPNWTGHRGTPGLLVQYNKSFAPTPGVTSYLVK